MPSPSAPVPDQRSSADAGGNGVHGESGGRWMAVASGGGFVHDLTPLVRHEAWGVGREKTGQESVKPQGGNWR